MTSPKKFLIQKRTARLEREIAVLESMDVRLFRLIFACGLLTIAALVGFFCLLFKFMHWFDGMPLVIVGLSALLAVVVWWLSYYSSASSLILFTLLFGLILILIVADPTGVADIPSGWNSSPNQKNPKSIKRFRIAELIARKRGALTRLKISA